MVSKGRPDLKNPNPGTAEFPRKKVYLALLVGWVALTFVLTSIPNLSLNVPLPYSDKLAHFGFYGVMGFLCGLWRRGAGFSAKRAILHAVVFVAVTGAIDEIHQHWIPGRLTDPFDWLADLSGGTVGGLFSSVLPRIFPFLLTE